MNIIGMLPHSKFDVKIFPKIAGMTENHLVRSEFLGDNHLVVSENVKAKISLSETVPL